MTHGSISSKTFEKGVKDLEEAFRYSYTKGQMTRLYAAIKGFSDRNFSEAVTALINTRKFSPTNADIIEAVRINGERDWRRQKDKEQEEAERFFNSDKHVHTEHVAAAQKLIRLFLTGTVSRKSKVQLMRQMGKKFPEFSEDWNEQANDLEQIFQRRTQYANGDPGALFPRAPKVDEGEGAGAIPQAVQPGEQAGHYVEI